MAPACHALHFWATRADRLLRERTGSDAFGLHLRQSDSAELLLQPDTQFAGR
jgi:hypothetical protein